MVFLLLRSCEISSCTFQTDSIVITVVGRYFSNRFYRYNRCWSIPIFSEIGANRGNRNLFLLKFLYTSDGRYLSFESPILIKLVHGINALD
jgi:hypothetical protein